MKHLAALLLFGFPTFIAASCITELPATLKIEVTGCQDVSFEGTPSKSRRTARAGLPLHAVGSSFEGTLLTARVIEIQSSPSDSQSAQSAQFGAADRREYFFVQATASETCPAMLPQQTSVTVEVRCCDTLPHLGACIVPFPSVSFADGKASWQPPGAEPNSSQSKK